MSDRMIKVADWAIRWGFSALVVLGAVAATWVAWQVDLPAPIPAFALQAAPGYRLEVGTATFAAVYLAATALGLAPGRAARPFPGRRRIARRNQGSRGDG